MKSEIIKERRAIEDRRVADDEPPFPFFDNEQTLVRENRRKIPDRRINNIEVNDGIEVTNIEASDKEATRLFLWHKEEVCELFPSSNEIIVGRTETCALIIENRYTSRQHARFKFENGGFSITDHSTNGTYIKNDEGEMFLMGEKIELHGSGIVSLGTPIDFADKDVIHFFCP
ncbi:MAG: FHA domain-containing protein [Gammaproteobacteria bacterium]